MFDIGVNLTSSQFSRDHDEVVARALAAGVNGMLLTGTNLAESQQAQKLGIRKLEGNEKGGTIEFAEKNHVNPVWLIGLLQKQPQHFRLDGPTRLKFMQELSERKTRIDWVRQFMRQLEENAVA